MVGYKDYYWIELSAAGSISVALEGAGEEAQLQLYRRGAIGDKLNGSPFVHDFTHEGGVPGRYYVYVHFPSRSPPIAYTLRVSY